MQQVATVFYRRKSGPERMVVFENSRKKTAARIHFDEQASRLTQIEQFDSSGHVQYEVTFSSYQTIEGYQVPYDIVVRNDAQYRAHLKVIDCWPHPPISASAFRLHKTKKR